MPADDERFLERYAAVRRDEGWGHDDAAYYRALPFRDLSGRHAEIWRIRAVSYRVLLRRVLGRPPFGRGKRLNVLDLGAGNGWLSYRLAQDGHRPVAVDLMTDSRDGLGAGRHYRPEVAFPCVKASFDQLPLADAGFDLAIFNGSFHYSRYYTRTFSEALRTVRPGGAVVVMDTPIYRRQSSGAAMLRERDAELRERYGFGADDHEGYLTRERLDRLGEELGLEWRIIRPFYGLRWVLRPIKVRLLGQRELMRFHLLVARRPSSS